MSPQPRRLHELPPFDPTTIALVRESCRRLPPRSAVLAREFYRALFAMAPEVRPMFPADMTRQQEKLLSALLAAVEALDDPVALEPQLRAWGAWHRRSLGVTDEMYVYVGHALLRALRQVFGHTETTLGSAWIAVYEWIAAAMIAGADEVEGGTAGPPGAVRPPATPATPATSPTAAVAAPAMAGRSGRRAAGTPNAGRRPEPARAVRNWA